MDAVDTYMAVCVACMFAAMVLHDRGMLCVPVVLVIAAVAAAAGAYREARRG